MLEYQNWLAAMPGISAAKKIALEEYLGEAEYIYRIPEAQLDKILFLTEKEQQAIIKARKKVPEEPRESLVTFGQPDYPQKLIHIYNPPYGIYYRGKLPEEGQKNVAVVGARNCSSYGRAAAEQASYGLAAAGVSIISGMAHGIDAAGHTGCLRAGGTTFGVLGSGTDICYPRENQVLYDRIQNTGGILSEYPPGTAPRPCFFPARNRIISGLSDVVLIVEAQIKSGSLITADFALEQGREVYAVPGRIGEKLSQGTNRLIQQGAGIFLETQDLLKEMNIFPDSRENSIQNHEYALENLERLVYSCVDLTPRSLEELMKESGLPLAELIHKITRLREMGLVSEIYKNYFIRSDIHI